MKNVILFGTFLFSFVFAVETTAQYNDCMFGQCDFGYGVMVYANGEKYVGEFDNRKRHGQGVYFLSNGDKYVGSWKHDKYNGEGRLYRRDGSVQAGIWSNNILTKYHDKTSGCLTGDCNNGYGVYLLEDGTKVVGIFQNGRPDGQVAVFYTNGSKYVGDFATFKKEGTGILSHPDGLIEEGFWKNDAYAGAEKSGKGCIEGDCNNGFGKYVYDDYTKYIGNFAGSYAHGYGECYYSDGDYYKGEWQAHHFHGKGTIYYADGTIQDGYWQAGEFLGSTPPETKVVEVTTPATKEFPKVYAVLVGVARYNHMKSLKYTDDDAYRMFAFLKSPEGGALADDQIKILIDEDASKDNILKTLNETFAKAGPNDYILFYFSGHGLKGAFLPIDYDGSNNRVEHADIKAILDKSQAKSKVVIADACHSGSLNGAKGATAQSVIETYYEAFSRSSGGTALMMSSKAEETSIENNGLRQGIFSHFLIRGLKGAADNDDNKLVTINELFEYVEANVKFYTNNYQTPVISGDYDSSLPMGVIRD
ncbi:MAG: caspase family protein [Saprospiraceae bacterium]